MPVFAVARRIYFFACFHDGTIDPIDPHIDNQIIVYLSISFANGLPDFQNFLLLPIQRCKEKKMLKSAEFMILREHIDEVRPLEPFVDFRSIENT